MWYENLQADDHTDLLRCHWLCFGFDPQMRVNFEGFRTGYEIHRRKKRGAGGIEKGEL